MRIAAQRDGGDRLLIVDEDERLGQVWSRETNELYPAHEVAAIAKFGYWTDYVGSEDPDAIVRDARILLDER